MGKIVGAEKPEEGENSRVIGGGWARESREKSHYSFRLYGERVKGWSVRGRGRGVVLLVTERMMEG